MVGIRPVGSRDYPLQLPLDFKRCIGIPNEAQTTAYPEYVRVNSQSRPVKPDSHHHLCGFPTDPRQLLKVLHAGRYPTLKQLDNRTCCLV